MIDLKAVYGKRYRIGLDSSYELEKYDGKTQDVAWYYEIIGRSGQLYNHSDTHLQIWISPRLGKLLYDNLPLDWTATQNTSEGFAFKFPNKDIGVAFKWIKPRKRRIGRPAP